MTTRCVSYLYYTIFIEIKLSLSISNFIVKYYGIKVLVKIITFKFKGEVNAGASITTLAVSI